MARLPSSLVSSIPQLLLRPLEAASALLQWPVGSESVRMDRISHRASGQEHAASGSSSTQTQRSPRSGMRLSISGDFVSFCTVGKGIVLLRSALSPILATGGAAGPKQKQEHQMCLRERAKTGESSATGSSVPFKSDIPKQKTIENESIQNLRPESRRRIQNR